MAPALVEYADGTEEHVIVALGIIDASALTTREPERIALQRRRHGPPTIVRADEVKGIRVLMKDPDEMDNLMGDDPPPRSA